MSKNKKVHVTFLEDPGLVREFKKACIDQGVSMRDVLHKAILDFMRLVEVDEEAGKFIQLPTAEEIAKEADHEEQ